MSSWKIIRVRGQLHERLTAYARQLGELYANNPRLCGPSPRESGALALTDVIEELLRRTEAHRRRARKAARHKMKAREGKIALERCHKDGRQDESE